MDSWQKSVHSLQEKEKNVKSNNRTFFPVKNGTSVYNLILLHMLFG